MFREMRRKDKQMSPKETMDLLIRGQEGVLGTFGDQGYPYTTVVNYVYLNHKIYFHSAREGHKIDNINQYDKVSFTVYDQVKVVGEKLETLYESVTVFGRAKVMNATHEILKALVKKYSNLEDQVIDQMIENEIDITAIIEIEIEHITGKRGK